MLPSSFRPRDRLISPYRRLIVSWVSAISVSVAPPSISGNPAIWPALVRFVAEISTACSQLSPSPTAFIPKAKETLRQYSNIEYAVADIQSIPYADQSFDFVIANMMLYHVPDIPKGLSEVRRVLRGGGAFCCATYGENGIMEYLTGLFREYGAQAEANHTFTLQNGREQLRAYFDTVERYDYKDSLEVTDVNDLADYIFSLAGMSSLRALPRETIVRVLRGAAVDGVLRVPKEYGLFLAR